MVKLYEEVECGPIADKLRSTTHSLAFPELFVKFGPSKCFLPRHFAEHLTAIDAFEVRDDDIWIVTYPKAGTTWTQEMTWLILNDLDYNGAKTILPYRSPFLEFTAIFSKMGAGGLNGELIADTDVGKKIGDSMERCRQLKSPRLIKSHLPFNMLPKQLRNGEKKAKIIYVAREPKDICVSYYHHRVTWESYLGTMQDSVEEFIGGHCMHGPYFPHLKEFWDIRGKPNLLFLTYEQMKKDLHSVLTKVSSFLEKSLTENDKSKLADHLSFENMKKNPATNYDESSMVFCEKLHGRERKNPFIRKGKVGAWKEELSPKQIELLDSWIEQNKIQGLYPMPT